ncbi:MAG: aspartate aminotransferase family protein [Deltaproteobacteria bacterium]|nr:aspartate aminotransferase family protein [Deltaproteobacteria bacterium]
MDNNEYRSHSDRLAVDPGISHPTHQKACIKTNIPGPKSQALRDLEQKHMAPGLQGFALMAGIAVDHAQGSAVTDVDGNTFIDIIGGIGVNGLGHSHPKFIHSVARQLAKASVGSFTSEARVDFLDRLAKHRPSELVHRAQLYSSGAEAVESALRLAKCHTGKQEFVSFWGGFHGKTMGVLSLMGSNFKDGLGPMVPGCHIVPFANPYRPPVVTGDLTGACIDLVRKQLKFQAQGRIAAFIIEPMQGTAGNVIPPDDFLPAVKELAREFGALLIADEMITGFGRTGKFWGCQHSGVEADIVTVGKLVGGGYPLSGIISTDAIVAAKPWSNPSGSSSSYGGNPLACAAAAASLRIIEEEKLVENSKRVGEYFLKKLQPMVDRYPFVGDVRGRGLFIGMELVKDKATKEPLPRPVTEKIFQECLKRGLLTMAYSASFRIQPALTIDEATVDEAVAILTEVFERVPIFF